MRHLCPILTQHGHSDLAYRLALNDSYPSWGYSIANGATTIWERWDGWTGEKGFQSPKMNSFNHYSLGSVGEWLFGAMAGIDAIEAAELSQDPPATDARTRRRSLRRPFPVATQDGSHPNGSDRRDEISYAFEVPANTLAIVELVAKGAVSILRDGEETTPLGWTDDRDRGRAKFELGSGSHQFAVLNARPQHRKHS